MTRISVRITSRSLALLLLVCAAGCLLLSTPGFSTLPKSDNAVAGTLAEPLVELKALPAALVLDNPRDMRRVIVSGRTQAGQWLDLSRMAKFRRAGSVVRVDEQGYVYPLKQGSAKLVISVRGRSIAVPVSVRSSQAPPISFVREVMPVLSKTGCNAGTCHGSAKGKNGFKLSLRGYDPEFDYHALVEDISGRRFNRADPADSLMLLKPTQEVPHQGGLVFDGESRYYATLKQWIQEGVQSDAGKVARAESLEILPEAPELPLPAMSQQLVVIAHYPDGTSRDVTRDVVYTSSTPDVAKVSAEGLVTAERRGETAILVRYEGAYATDYVTVMGDRSEFQWADAPEFNYIDALVYKKLKRIKVSAGKLCTDAEFIRRIYLDLCGLPPTPERIRTFLADPTDSKTRREKLIDELLASPQFVEHWTNKWADLLQCDRRFLGERGVWRFRQWIKDSVASNKPYDQFVRELLSASGSTYENPPASYFRVCREPPLATENVTQLFLGVRFACAKCHDHPFERWTQKQYYQFGAFFARVALKPGRLEGDEVLWEKPEGEVTYPKDGRVMTPTPPVGHADEGAASRRIALATWLTSPDNPMFARAMANRIWSYLLGRGIIDPVDDIRSSNPPTNPELLEALAEDFVKHGFDIQHLMRTICRSRVYQHSIATDRWNEDDNLNFAHALPRRLTAEQLMDAIAVTTGTRLKFPDLPTGIRAAQLPDSQVGGGFLQLFGRPTRESNCECARRSEVSLGQTLNLINGPTIAEAIIDPQGRVAKLMQSNPDDRKLVEELYLAGLCRLPTDDEFAKASKYFEGAASRTEGAQDLLWALINTPAFLFNR